MSDVVMHLTKLIEDYQTAYSEAGELPKTDYLDEWKAPCYSGEVRYGRIGWKPVRQPQPLDFSGVEKGLELELHPDVKDFYGVFFAGDLHLHYNQQQFTLLQVISPEDGERLQRNIIGHVLMKQRLQQSLTLFVGVSAASEDVIISVDNTTGVVGLEYVGKEQHEKLANSMAELLMGSEPRVVNDE